MEIRLSIKIVNSNAIFIPILALSGIMIFPSPIAFLPILSFIIYPIVYGHFVETIMSSPRTSWFNLFKTHWLNYLVISLIMGLPIIILVSAFDDMAYIQKEVTKNVLGFAINCLAIYIVPLVFIKRQIEDPIIQGIAIISTKIKKSMPLILMTLLIFFLKLLFYLYVIRLFHMTYLNLFVVGFIQNFITVYLGLIIFATATIFIKEQINTQTNQTEYEIAES